MGLLLEPGTTLAIEEISDLKAIERDWARLLQQLPEPRRVPIFSLLKTPAAQVPPQQIKILTAHSDDVLGIVPLYGNGTLRILGSDALILPGFERVVMDAVTEHLRRQSDWRACEWDNLRSDSPLLLSDFGPDYTDVVEAEHECPILTLAGNDRSGAFKPFSPEAQTAPADPNTYRRVIRRI